MRNNPTSRGKRGKVRCKYTGCWSERRRGKRSGTKLIAKAARFFCLPQNIYRNRKNSLASGAFVS
jgi:hypothetical protein